VGKAFSVDFDDTEVPLQLSVTNPETGGITGLAPTVAIRKGDTLDEYLDFDDFTFKTAGWVIKYAAMDEAENGHYHLTIDVSSIGLSPGDSIIAEYEAIDTLTALKGVDSDVISITSSSERMKEIWQILGLDPTQPMTVSAIDRKTGTNIEQTVTIVGNAVTVTRV